MSTSPSTTLPAGALVGGRFRVERQIGRGGMGSVYLARQEMVDRPVALKVLKPDIATDKSAVERFVAEARAVSLLRNPHTVTLYDVGRTADDQLYYAMELIEGATLAEVIAQGPLPWPRALRIVRQVAESLAEAHELGIFHRDIKPDNVLLDAGHGGRDFARVVDFGIAKLQNDQVNLTQTGTVLGTPAYLSPEQARGDPVDGQTDIYSLGVFLFEMLAGRRPFEDRKVTALLLKHVNEPAPSVRDSCPNQAIPPEIDALVQMMMAKDPLDRPPSARVLQSYITEMLKPVPAPQPRPGRLVWIAGGVALVGLAVAGWLASGDESGGVGTSDASAAPDAAVVTDVSTAISTESEFDVATLLDAQSPDAMHPPDVRTRRRPKRPRGPRTRTPPPRPRPDAKPPKQEPESVEDLDPFKVEDSF